MYPNSERKKEGLGFETSGFSTYRMITYDFIGDTMSTDYSYPPPPKLHYPTADCGILLYAHTSLGTQPSTRNSTH